MSAIFFFCWKKLFVLIYDEFIYGNPSVAGELSWLTNSCCSIVMTLNPYHLPKFSILIGYFKVE